MIVQSRGSQYLAVRGPGQAMDIVSNPKPHGTQPGNGAGRQRVARRIHATRA